MIYRVACLLARIRFTVGYVAALASVSTTILMHGPQVHAQVIRHASTNLHNLAHGHLGTLWNSAFVIDEGPLYFWLPCLACLLAVAELQLRSLRLTVAFVVGHIGRHCWWRPCLPGRSRSAGCHGPLAGSAMSG